jgi:hypothetical protein
VPTQFAAYLRVYEPLTAFAPDRQRFWRRYAAEGRAIGPDDGPGRQRTVVMEALGAGWSRLPELPEEAYIMGPEDAVLVCPWNLRKRVAQAALQARDGVPQVLADAFVPPALAGIAQNVVASGDDEERMHEQVATWGVPLRWFVLFSPGERDLTTGKPRTLRFRAEIGKSRQRVHKGLRVLRRALGDVPITESLRDTARWLEQFHPGSMVELDYGGLIDLLSDDALLNDDSVELVATGLAGLAQDDGAGATAAYEKLVQRWRAIQLLERSN